MPSASDDVRARIEAIEAGYDYFLSYAARGLTSDEGAAEGGQLRDFLEKMESALDGLAAVVASAAEGQEPDDAWSQLTRTVDTDAASVLAVVRLISARPGVSSELIDSLNSFVHLRALLTDMFLVDDLLE